MENVGLKPEMVKPFIGFIILNALLGLSLLIEKLLS
jgi:hypothetical protein